MIKGIAVSAGIAWGTAFLLQDPTQIPVPRRKVPADDIPREWGRLDSAIQEAEKTLLALQQDVRAKIGEREAGIFDAHIMLLHDPGFMQQVKHRCESELMNVEAALYDIMEKYSQTLGEITDPYLHERAADVRDVGRRVLEILMKDSHRTFVNFPEGSVIVASELFPSATARMNMRTVRGIVTEGGGRTSHASILTRSLGLPAVISAPEATHKIRSGDQVIVDGLAGVVHVNPSTAMKEEYARLEMDFLKQRKSLLALIHEPSVTRDGMKVKLCANVGKIADADAARNFNADGIGLYRTEFNFFVLDRFPGVDQQVDAYENVAARIRPRGVVIRVLDMGSDKILPYFPVPHEVNPSLGRQGIRLLLKFPEILETQLTAILRLSAAYPISILFPMISSVEELREAKAILEKVKAALAARHQHFNHQIRVGAMIEVPSAAIMARAIARETDFVSIGTNDLIQYLLAADRTSAEVFPYYEPLHPAVLHAIKNVVDAGRLEGKSVSICGEMAGTPLYTGLLLGLGLRNFSVTPGEILEVKNAIRSTDTEVARKHVRRLLEMSSAQEIKGYLLQQPEFSDVSNHAKTRQVH
jgi:phosphotransferase system enzyme I (PtsI)